MGQKPRMIIKLDNTNDLVASQIYAVFQSAYRIEAQLIRVVDFPPLKRTADDIKNSKSEFYGLFEGGTLAGGIELELDGKQLEINSLVVDPNHFRKGIAGKLIDFALQTFVYSLAVVETAVANSPAIRLYQKHGFVEFKRWTPSHGIEKLALSKS